MLSGRILITGGAGFLARGLYRRARREGWPAEFVALSRDDSKHAALQARYPEVGTVLADVGQAAVRDLAWLMRGFDCVIHAAASKYVDRAERAAFDTVQTNIEGSARVARAAIDARVPLVLGISTDKAPAPLNVYGMTKAVMERLLQEADGISPRTRFKVVRYGNVVGSTGSVIPLFERWREAGEPIRLTDPTMTRFWMGVDEAIDAILWTLAEGSPGHVAVPPLRAMKMGNLVRALLGDLAPYGGALGPLPDPPVVEIVGLRPGEKRHETIMLGAESVRASMRGGRGYIEIAPAPTPPREAWAPDVTSADPPGGWVEPEAMLALIEDARNV